MIVDAISAVLNNQNCDIDAQECFDEMFSGLCDPVLSGIYITLLKLKGLGTNKTLQAINSARAAIKKYNLDVNYDYLIENIYLNQNTDYIDISFATDIICAACDVPVVKMTPSNCFYKNYSFDTLKAFGVEIEKLQNDSIEKNNFLYGYMNNEDNPYLKYTQELFRILPFENILNITNKFLNQYNVKNCSVALCDKSRVQDFANICLSLGYVNSVVFSADNFPFVSIEDETFVCEAWKNKIFSYSVTPELLGIEQNPVSCLRVENVSHGAEILKAVFENKIKDSFYDAVIINSAFSLYIVKRANSLMEGINLARKTIDSNLASEKLNSIKNTF